MATKYIPPTYAYFPIYLLFTACIFSIMSMIFPFIAYGDNHVGGPYFYANDSLGIQVFSLFGIGFSITGAIFCLKSHRDPVKYPFKVWGYLYLISGIIIWGITFFKFISDRLEVVEIDVEAWSEISFSTGLFLLTGGMICTGIGLIFINLEIKAKRYYNFPTRRRIAHSNSIIQSHELKVEDPQDLEKDIESKPENLPHAKICPKCNRMVLKNVQICPVCKYSFQDE